MSEQEIHEAEVEAVEADAVEETAADEAPEVEAPETPEMSEAEARARRDGWKPKEDWKGDTSGWTDFEEFNRRNDIKASTAAELREELKRERADYTAWLERIERANQAALAKERERVKAEMRTAVEMGDVEAYDRLSKQSEDLAKQEAPDPAPQSDTRAKVEEFRKSNDWAKNEFLWNAAASVAGPIIQRRLDAGEKLTVEQQMEIASEAAKTFAPHLFATPTPKPQVSAVDGGGLRQPGRARAKGWDDIPSEDRKQAQTFIKDGLMTKDEYAKSYWSDDNV